MKKSLLSFCLLFPTFCAASAPVVDAQASYYNGTSNDSNTPLSQDPDANQQSSASMINSNSPASLLTKMNQLQSELQRIRGQVEVQAHEIQVLKSQQQAYYNDLDQRISQKTKTSTTALNMGDDSNNSAAVIPVATPPKPSEESLYNKAYSLIEKKQFTNAQTAMADCLKAYPNGKYAANAHYWLGELALAQNKNTVAISEFGTVVNKFPSSSKVSASMLKLGYAYANQGNIIEAKKQLQAVQKRDPNSVTAQLAAERLEMLR